MRVVVVITVVLLAGCGSAGTLFGMDVTMVPTSECTFTGQSPGDCADEIILAQQSIEGRWIVDRSGGASSVSITTHEGRTLPGLVFDNDLRSLNAPGCQGEGGLCAFTRRRFSSTDLNNPGCRRFGELVALGHLDPDDDHHFIGFFTDIRGLDVSAALDPDACGTATVTELAFAVDGIVVDDPVFPRGER